MRHTQTRENLSEQVLMQCFWRSRLKIALQKPPLRHCMSYMPTTQKLLPQLFKIPANTDKQVSDKRAGTYI